MKTKILKITGSWQDVVDDCRATVGKEPLGHEPSASFKKKILIAEHSPIRNLRVRWIWAHIKSWVATHWVRHTWECFVRTQRPDRTGVPRDGLPQGAIVTFTGVANPQHTIDTWRKRLCYQASPETREYAEDFKRVLHGIEPEWSDVLVPHCVYRGGCPEMQTCGFWKHLCLEADGDMHTDDIQSRYDYYNEVFWGHKDKERKEDLT
jgi:hypothetical protein